MEKTDARKLTQEAQETLRKQIVRLRKAGRLNKEIKEHWDGILSHFDNRLTTGFLEGINSLIQSAKARARGYRNPKNMITMAYLIAGNSVSTENAINPLEMTKSLFE